jgi:hypothetical protein
MIRDWEILSNKCFFYLAKNLAEVQPQHLDSGEDIEISKIPLKAIPAKIENKEIDHGMVLLALKSQNCRLHLAI